MDAPACYAHLPRPVMPRVPPQKLLLGHKALVTGASSGTSMWEARPNGTAPPCFASARTSFCPTTHTPVLGGSLPLPI